MNNASHPGNGNSRVDDRYPQHSDLTDVTMSGVESRTTPALARLARLRSLGTVHERVAGPFHGYYIVSRGCCIGETGDDYIGSYKICDQRPASFGHAKAKFIGWSGGADKTSLAAMQHAEAAAKERIQRTFSADKPTA